MVRKMNNKDIVLASMENFRKLAEDDELLKKVDNVARCIVNAVLMGNKVMICGNGGSAADAQHMAGELVGRFYHDRLPVAAIALTTDTSVLTAVSNDFSFNEVFARQVKALGQPHDIIIGISTSGDSENVLAAFKIANVSKILKVLLRGEKDGEIDRMSDIIISVPSNDTPRVQEMHLLIEHIICQKVEEQLCQNQ